MSRRRARLGWGRGLALAALVAAGGLRCGLVLDFDPPEARHMECTATVENPDGIRVDVSSLTHPDFVRPVPSFTGGGGVPTGGGGATAPLRPYYVCEPGATCGPCSFADATAAEADWRRWLPQRIAEVAALADSPSLFRMHAGPWCVVPGTLRCEAREIVDRAPACGGALTAGPIADCGSGPPPTGQCLEVRCRDAVPCTAIDFGLVPTGASATESVELANCGDPTMLPVGIAVDPAVMPITLDADFAISRNGCAARPGDPPTGRLLQLPSVDPAESTCSFDVTFAPTHAGLHEGTTAFASEVDPSHTIRLTGQVAGGGATLDTTSPFCLEDDTPPGDCSAVGVIRVSNGGPGSVTVDDVRFAFATSNFFVRSPPPPPFPIVLAPGAPPLEIRVQWCRGGAGETANELVIDSNADPPIEPIKVGFHDPVDCP